MVPFLLAYSIPPTPPFRGHRKKAGKTTLGLGHALRPTHSGNTLNQNDEVGQFDSQARRPLSLEQALLYAPEFAPKAGNDHKPYGGR